MENVHNAVEFHFAFDNRLFLSGNLAGPRTSFSMFGASSCLTADDRSKRLRSESLAFELLNGFVRRPWRPIGSAPAFTSPAAKGGRNDSLVSAPPQQKGSFLKQNELPFFYQAGGNYRLEKTTCS